MRASALPLMLFAMLAWCLPARAQSYIPNAGLPRICEGRGTANAGTIYFSYPVFGSPELAQDNPPLNRHKLAISPSGQFVFDGTAVAPENLRDTLAKAAQESRGTVSIVPSSLTPASYVIIAVKALNSVNACNFHFAGTQLYDKVFNHKAPTSANGTIPPGQGFSIWPDTLMHVAYEAPAPSKRRLRKLTDTGCRAYFGGHEVNSNGLMKSAAEQIYAHTSLWFGTDDEALWNRLFSPAFVGHSAISMREARERNLSPPDMFLNAAIHTKGSTPWMCVAGAVWAAQASGHAKADLISLP